jgi:uncharacterized protein YdhG (YjbR/CyaY superfamily)
MKSDAETVEEYLDELPPDRREAIATIRDVINQHLPEGYVEQMEWGMVSWVVPLAEYPDTYNGKPLCYVSLASQKNHMAVYLMGLYTEGGDEAWFRQQYADRGMKLDMGKSCVVFKRLDELPLDVLGDAVARIPVGSFVARYEDSRKR